MIGIVAPSSVVPRQEIRLAVEKLEELGFRVAVHPQVHGRWRFYAGTDSERASAFLDYAFDPGIEVLWCARGGSGAIRTLAEIERQLDGAEVPARKLLVGYSDATALMEYARARWGWHTLHGPMPGLREFSILRDSHWKALACLLNQARTSLPTLQRPLRWITEAPKAPIEGPLHGGNLCVWGNLIGTPFEASARGGLLFLEEVAEAPYRIDRQLSQLELSGAFRDVKAIVLGTFERCEDAVPEVLRDFPNDRSRERVLRSPKPSELKPLRPRLRREPVIREIFRELGARLGIPVAEGLPVGHGPEYPPLPLGATYRLERSGRMSLVEWGWLKK